MKEEALCSPNTVKPFLRFHNPAPWSAFTEHADYGHTDEPFPDRLETTDHALPIDGLEAGAVFDAVLYDQLSAAASFLLRGERAESLFQPRDLVHEAFVRLTASGVCSPAMTRAHYISLAIRAMRHTLIDRARARKARKRFGQLRQIPLTPDAACYREKREVVLGVQQALQNHAQISARQASVCPIVFA